MKRVLKCYSSHLLRPGNCPRTIWSVTIELDKSFDPTKAGLNREFLGAPKIGAGAEAKLAAKGCVQVKG